MRGQVLGLGGQVLGLGLGLGGQVLGLGLGLGGQGLGLGLDPSGLGLGLGICGLDSKSGTRAAQGPKFKILLPGSIAPWTRRIHVPSFIDLGAAVSEYYDFENVGITPMDILPIFVSHLGRSD